MLPAIRAEFRKLLTVRSTYVVSGLALLLMGFIAFYGMGYKAGANYLNAEPHHYQEAVLNAVSIVQIFSAIVAILLITHEYRYNTIMHTLTITNRRMKVLWAKVLTVIVYSAVFAAIALALATSCIAAGIHLGGHHMVGQQFAAYSVIWKTLVFTITGTLAGLVFGFLSRSIVFAIVAFFILPTTVEPLLHNLLKISTNYLPFSAQNQILLPGGDGAYSALASAGVFMAYLVGAWIIAALLFVKRDAN